VALVVATAFLGDGLIGAVDEANPLTPTDVLALCARDARALLVGGNVEGGSVEGGKINILSLIYRSSALLGILVGASFALSPIDPIGIFDEEGAVSTLMRQICGVYLAFVLAPIETILYRAVQRGALSEPPVRALNAVVGFSDLLLIVDGRVQVDSSTARFTALQQDEPSSSLLPSSARPATWRAPRQIPTPRSPWGWAWLCSTSGRRCLPRRKVTRPGRELLEALALHCGCAG
jgi:hypothetical protein